MSHSNISPLRQPAPAPAYIFSSPTKKKLNDSPREAHTNDPTIFHQFTNQKNAIPYFLDHSNCFSFEPWCQQHFIDQYVHLLEDHASSTTTTTNTHNTHNNTHHISITTTIREGICFALCLHWAKSIIAQHSSTNMEQYQIQYQQEVVEEEERLFLQCVSLQMESRNISMYQISTLLLRMGFRRCTPSSLASSSPSSAPLHDHTRNLTNKNSRLIQFLFRNHNNFDSDRFLLLFLSHENNNNCHHSNSGSGGGGGSGNGHVICVAKLHHDHIALFDPNEGTVHFSYQFAQQHVRGAFDLAQLIQEHCLVNGYDHVYFCEFGRLRNRNNNDSNNNSSYYNSSKAAK